uniref:Putative secreted protein n=1 Tax=Anopheles marajoara TaxID=58244 RepID=A0A2M4CEX5_9DIPT
MNTFLAVITLSVTVYARRLIKMETRDTVKKEISVARTYAPPRIAWISFRRTVSIILANEPSQVYILIT